MTERTCGDKVTSAEAAAYRRKEMRDSIGGCLLCVLILAFGVMFAMIYPEPRPYEGCRDCDLRICGTRDPSVDQCMFCPNYASWRTYRNIVNDIALTSTVDRSISSKLCAFCMGKVRNLEDFKLCKNDCRDYANEIAAADRPP